MTTRLRTPHKAFILSILLSLIAFSQVPGSVLAQEDDGGALFKAKCSACHTIGGGRLVGPDLQGVTATRDRNWLMGFITAPDQVIAKGDPVAALTEKVKLPPR